MLAEFASIGEPSDWKEFGLGGLVIFALFVVVIGVMVAMINSFNRQISSQEQQQKSQLKSQERMFDAHTEERNRWMEAMERRDDKMDRALTSLVDAIRGKDDGT